jgi:hypothetical protein
MQFYASTDTVVDGKVRRTFLLWSVGVPECFGHQRIGVGVDPARSEGGHLTLPHRPSNANNVVFDRDAPDTAFAGYPADRISGQSKSRIPDIRPDTVLSLKTIFLVKYQINL